MRTASLPYGLETGAGGIQTALIISARCLLILGYDLLIGGFSALTRRTVMDFAYGCGQIIDETFGFFRLRTGAICNCLEPSLQIAELLGRGVIVALPKLVKLALQLGEAALFGLIDLSGERPGIAAILLNLTSLLTGGAEISSL